MDPLPAFAAYANRSFFVSTSQHVAAWCVESDAETVDNVAPPNSWYEETAPFGAAPDASETISWSRVVTAKPNGPLPLDGRRLAVVTSPAAFTVTTSMAPTARCVTNRSLPSRVLLIVDGPSLAEPSDTCEIERGRSSPSTANPEIELSPLST